MYHNIILDIDGTFYGVLTAIFEVFSQKLNVQNATITCRFNIKNQGFFDRVIPVKTDEEKALRVLKKLRFLLSKKNYQNLFIAIKSGSEDMHSIVFSYALKIILENKDVTDNFSDLDLFLYDKLVKAVRYEAHRFKGFLRFSKLDNGVFYAKYSPDNDVTELITPHFTKRFPNMPFIIHDEIRGILSAHVSGKTVYKKSNLSSLKVKDELSCLFKTYCDAVTINQRNNTRLMLNYMPKRYHKNAPEKDELLNC